MRSIPLCLLAAALSASCGRARPPVEPREGFVSSADGVPIHWRDQGEGEPALVFVHCWSCDATYWDAQVAHFAPARRVITLDLAGHGLSGLERSAWTMETYADDVRAVVEHLDVKRFVLVAHSMGGLVGLEAARRMPERVAALVPVDTLHDAERVYDPEEVEGWLRDLQADFRGAAGSYVRALFPPGADPALVERVANDMASAPAAVAIASTRAVFAYDARAALGEVRAPIHALMSETIPYNLEVNRRHAPQFEAEAVPGTGHFPMLEKPEEFNRRLEAYLAALAKRGPS